MAYEDIGGRRPPFVETIKKGVIQLKALSKSSTFSGRSRHFREAAGAISWDKREGSANIKSYIEDIVRPEDNSTRGSRDLTRSEVKKLRLANYGTKPGRSKQGTTEESKKRYNAGWDKREGSDKIKVGIEDSVRPEDNSTRGSRDLTRSEVKKLRLANYGTKPGRSKQGTTEESKKRYNAGWDKRE